MKDSTDDKSGTRSWWDARTRSWISDGKDPKDPNRLDNSKGYTDREGQFLIRAARAEASQHVLLQALSWAARRHPESAARISMFKNRAESVREGVSLEDLVLGGTPRKF